ncbi:RteC domain-containing protein [Chryseobacterium sp. NKUCC03_KSP]|uniref:RteC domain-containing protein n=1 Tax=Chryseobacterium sp. NKUCC03_KSP TaxID=2842125 RepID=UPI001C5B2D53|nr:RteC domain-containing protein [Chryseobacterium sp. NKUCC03_KSP]MBW3523881.1 RteC domain-containing protein [Chryseobacterium sp. NKUCC03_KSP]
MKQPLHTIIAEIQKQERKLSAEAPNFIDEAYRMTVYLQELLHNVKEDIIKDGFANKAEEIRFFKQIKPNILGKLIYYNKVYRIETACPAENGHLYQNYFALQLQGLQQEYKEHICNSDFYRYYRSGRTDRDEHYYSLGNINYYDGLNSFVFEIDTKFSTYFDYKVAKIIANELIYNYLTTKLNPEQTPDVLLQNADAKDIFWTQTKNALIELIYALHAADALSHGKLGIRKISTVFQILFRISLTDIHNSFHRMKTRAGSRTLFLDQLKYSLEEYMDREDNG